MAVSMAARNCSALGDTGGGTDGRPTAPRAANTPTRMATVTVADKVAPASAPHRRHACAIVLLSGDQSGSCLNALAFTLVTDC
jgi:hypothetical protein